MAAVAAVDNRDGIQVSRELFLELGVLSISIVCYNAPDKKGSQDNTFLMNGIGYSASLEDTGLGGKGGKGGGQ